jgi:tetratricopeptide (TPR) repeat protein
VAKKHKSVPARLSAADLAARVRRAENEGRSQQALELAKQLYKQEPTPAYKDLLKRMYLFRAQQLRQQGYTRDAGTVLLAAIPLGTDDPAWMEKAAGELAAAGEIRATLDLLEKLPQSPARLQVLGKAVDQALRKGKAGRDLLPESLRDPCDRIVQAFAQTEAGQDEQARTSLQEIGLQSPFLEWKLLLRGLMAYYQKDDARALENWQRLNPERLPARLAAPLRFGLDSAYRAAQPPQTQTALQKQADRLLDNTVVQSLRVIQSDLATGDHLAQTFRIAENLLPSLRQLQPQLVSRLASCFYWAIIQEGQPEDMTRFRRVFGEPADDPGFHRLQALVGEHIGNFSQAHKEWQAFEKTVATNPTAWPGEQAPRVRALIWCHMGRNAGLIPNEEQLAKLPPFLRNHPDRPKALKPSAEECFRRSLELAPEQLEPYEDLFHHYQREHKPKKMEQAARQLLARFPDHVPTLVALSDLRAEQQDYAEALTLLQQALKNNPLDRKLRSKLSTTHLFNARAHAEAGQFDEARQEYQTTLALDARNEAAVLCKWAACEFKAGNDPRAEELLQQALGKAGSRLAIAFSMLIETIRLKLPRPLKLRFDKDFNESLAEPPTAAGAVDSIDTAATHRVSGIKYYGQKTHEKKVLAYLDRAGRTADFSEDQLQKICQSLLDLEATTPLRTFTALGRQRFGRNPFFPFLEAESYIAKGPERLQIWRVQPLLEEARQLASQLPQDEQIKDLQQQIHDRQEMINALNPFANMFQNMYGGDSFGGPFGGEDDFWEEDYEDEDDWFDDGYDEDDFVDPFEQPRRQPKKKRRRR